MRHHARCVACIVRYLDAGCEAPDHLKHISAIFDMDPSDIDRHFRAVKGMTMKHYLDERKKEKLLSLLNTGFDYGYEFGDALGFTSDQAFYHWVKRVFGKTFTQLRAERPQITKMNPTQRA